jgi:hypothetical protein
MENEYLENFIKVFLTKFQPAKSFEDSTLNVTLDELVEQVNNIVPVCIKKTELYNVLLKHQFVYDAIPNTVNFYWLIKVL